MTLPYDVSNDNRAAAQLNTSLHCRATSDKAYAVPLMNIARAYVPLVRS